MAKKPTNRKPPEPLAGLTTAEWAKLTRYCEEHGVPPSEGAALAAIRACLKLSTARYIEPQVIEHCMTYCCPRLRTEVQP